MRPGDKRKRRARKETAKLLSPLKEKGINIDCIIQCGLGDWAEGPVLLNLFPNATCMAVEPIHRYCHEAWAAGFRGSIIQGLLWNETGLKKKLNDWRTRTSVHDEARHGLGSFSTYTLTLDDAVKWCVFPENHECLLWMDVEGAELEILKGAEQTLKSVVAIVCELKRGERLPGWPQAEEMMAVIESLGYKMEKEIQPNALFLRR